MPRLTMPDDFIFSAWGKTIWGSAEDISTLDTDFKLLRQNFTNVPLVLGEYAASPETTEPAARWKWLDRLVRTANKYNVSTILWDNGADFLDRNARKWRDVTAPEIIISAQQGVNNSLPDSIEENKAEVQWSSATVFHKVGDPVQDVSLPFLLHDNTLESITVGELGLLRKPADYTVSEASQNGKVNITLKKRFLDSYISSSAGAGVKANLTAYFSAGAKIQIQVLQWEVPKLVNGAKGSKAAMGKDLEIPITWQGFSKLAAVKGIFDDGSYLADDWTKWLGKLQAGYLVSSGLTAL